ncbi:FGGY family carbohydrate kinase [Mucilaginibacter sp. PAMB04274]|uniref:FGGY-family carbohydrate kinase n=1 Tax=Mucilaginibacter sp. PAMB04274 TaxID=3138568 RepID=UPI0031F69B64
MTPTPVIAVFDVGKTNKKLFLLDEDYNIVYEKSARFIETLDEDGDACENLESLQLSIFDSLHEIYRLDQFEIRAINFSSYGASLVYINEQGEPLAPLYNYLKAYPEEISRKFYQEYGSPEKIAAETASPVLGNLNSGMQLYRIKHQKPDLFNQVKYALHLPQYLSLLVSGAAYSDITSIGCHTQLWDFNQQDYHSWVKAEHLRKKLAPIFPSNQALAMIIEGRSCAVGIGLHDSSAALIPYLVSFTEPFVLLSTGTWCISLNPFNNQPLTPEELSKDCLAYLQYQGKPVKASRVFSGNEHEQEVKRIAAWFKQSVVKYRTMPYQPEIIAKLKAEQPPASTVKDSTGLITSGFSKRDLAAFATDIEAYHQLMLDLASLQYQSTQLVLQGTSVKDIYVDGGFGKNEIFMNLLADLFPDVKVWAASVAQATAVGTALAIHKSWNNKALPNNLIQLKRYNTASNTVHI